MIEEKNVIIISDYALEFKNIMEEKLTEARNSADYPQFNYYTWDNTEGELSPASHASDSTPPTDEPTDLEMTIALEEFMRFEDIDVVVLDYKTSLDLDEIITSLTKNNKPMIYVNSLNGNVSGNENITDTFYYEDSNYAQEFQPIIEKIISDSESIREKVILPCSQFNFFPHEKEYINMHVLNDVYKALAGVESYNFVEKYDPFYVKEAINTMIRCIAGEDGKISKLNIKWTQAGIPGLHKDCLIEIGFTGSKSTAGNYSFELHQPGTGSYKSWRYDRSPITHSFIKYSRYTPLLRGLHDIAKEQETVPTNDLVRFDAQVGKHLEGIY